MDAFNQGKSIEEIAEFYGIGRTQVANIVSDFSKTKTLTMDAFWKETKTIEEIL